MKGMSKVEADMWLYVQKMKINEDKLKGKKHKKASKKKEN